ncbi:MAG: pyruvate formate lyase family protein, partial [Microvirgula sp.]
MNARDTMLSPAIDPWSGFAPGVWQQQVDVCDFIQRNYTPYDGDERFLAPATERTRALWQALGTLLAQERERGVLDVSTDRPAGITAHAAGYIDQGQELIVGLQTDAPLKRAIMPNGGLRMVESGLKAYGFELDPAIRDIWTRHRKSHNQGVFDIYSPDVLAARKSAIITGLPDAYGRGRIIGDYRRVALYGTDALREHKQREFHALDNSVFTDDVMRLREELSEQWRALDELRQMAASYG